MKENDYCRRCKTRDYCEETNMGCSFAEVYEKGYIAGLKEMYAVLSEIVPTGILKEFDVTDYIQTKIQEQQ